MRYSLLLAVAVSLGAPNRARADVYSYYVSSLESLTDASTVIVLGTVVREKAAGAKEATTHLKGVERAVKGTADKPFPAIENLSRIVKAPGENRVLLFLRPAAKPPALEVDYIIYLNKHTVPANADRAGYYRSLLPHHTSAWEPKSFHSTHCIAVEKTGNVLIDPESVIKAVEARVKLHPKRVSDECFYAKRGQQLEDNESDYNVLVPYDPEFRKDFLEELGSDHGWYRYVAVLHLSHYKDDEVIAALKKCLTDDYVCELRIKPDDPGRPKPYFAVRRAAYEALRAWNIDVARPELEPPPHHAPPPRPGKKPE
jgi:hypothetical protein